MAQDSQDVPQSESKKEKAIKDKKPREKKELGTFKPWDTLAKEKVDITWAQLFEASPLVCTSIKEGISDAKKGMITQILNVAPKKK